MDKLCIAALFAGKAAQSRKEEIKLAHCTGDFVVGLAEATMAASISYSNARQHLSELRAALVALRDEARVFTMLSCDILKPIYGRSYSEAWDITGFKGSLASPLKPADLMLLALALSRFFGSRPELELPTREITAIAAAALAKRIDDARVAVNFQEMLTDELKQQRDLKFTALRKCMRNMIEELNILLEPLDSRWLGFGFNKPGAQQTPDAPEKVQVVVIENKRANITWPAPARAEYYRVWMRIEGVNAERVAIGTPSDPDFMLEELPTQGAVDFFISAVNSGGESALSAPVRLAALT